MLTPNVAQPRILVMSMVKNEEQIINRMFGRFDVMICDTGSTDDTIQVSMNQSVHIFKSPVGWINFEYNRNECLQATRTYMLSHPEYTHVLLMDADHVISMQTESPIEYDVNIIQIHGDVHNELPYLLSRNALLTGNCTYRLWTHEFLECTSTTLTHGHFSGFHFIHHQDGASRDTKHTRDIMLLSKWLTEINEPDLIPRATFYLASAYDAIGNHTIAQTYYLDHLNVETFTNYRFQSRYRLALIAVNAQKPSDELTSLFLSALDEYEGVERWEIYYYLARAARAHGHYNQCIMYTGAALQSPKLGRRFRPLFLEPVIYDWALEEERAFCLRAAGRALEAGTLYRAIIDRGNVNNPAALKRMQDTLLK